MEKIPDVVYELSNPKIEFRKPADRKMMWKEAGGGEVTKKKKSRWKNPAALLTNPLNSQLDTNVVPETVEKKWISYCLPSVL